MSTYVTKLEEDENGEPILIIPDEIVEEYGLKEGDKLKLKVDGDKIIINFEKHS